MKLRAGAALAALFCLWLGTAGAAGDAAGRVVAVGDVHGAGDELAAILEKAGLVDARRTWIGGNATLVQTGDVTDRGTGMRAALDLLMALEEQARKAGGRVHAVLGNHEVMNMVGELRDATPEIFETFGGEAAMREAFSPRGRYGRWLRGKRVMLQSSSHVEGDIFHQALAIEQGAFFEGKSRRSDDPTAEAKPARTHSRRRRADARSRRCWRMWCLRQRSSRFVRSVGPWAVQWVMWWASHQWAGMSQPGSTQVRSRAARERRSAGVIRRVRRPTSRTSESPRMTIRPIAASHANVRTSVGDTGP